MELICPRCRVIYADRSICPLCYARLRILEGKEEIHWDLPSSSPSMGFAAIAVGHGLAAFILARLQFTGLLPLYLSGLSWWMVLPAVLVLSIAMTVCLFSAYGLLADKPWGLAMTRRALKLLLFAFPIGTIWGIGWLVFLSGRRRPPDSNPA